MVSTSGCGPPKSDQTPNIVPASFGLLLLGFFSALYILRRETYFDVLDWWSFRPFQYPFIDLIYLPAQISCWEQGIDVYRQNPCDPLGRLHDYSPLWLRLSFLGSAGPHINAFGVAMDGLFMLSLAALPRPRCKADYLPVILAVVSPTTVFAMERGNVDTLMFLFAIAAVVCMDRALPVRMVGYGMIELASLLKFYPFVLFVLLLRERFHILLVLSLTAGCLMFGLIAFYFDEIPRMLANIPQPATFADTFGAAQLPAGIAVMLSQLFEHADPGAPAAASPPNVLLALPISAMLIVATFLTARYLAKREDLRSAVRALTQRESICLVAGAALVCGCFVSGRSMGYRQIIMLLALPGLSALTRTAATDAIARMFRSTTWIAVFLMIYLLPQRLVNHLFATPAADQPPFAALSLWLVRELCWWWLVAVLAAVLVRFVLDSPVLARPRPGLDQKKRSNHSSVSAGDSSAM